MDLSIYRRLDEDRQEIRLLEIKPAVNDDDLLKCELISVPLSTTLDFSTMSYVWGDVTITKEIAVNGQAFAVTTNLVSALRYLRMHFRLNSLYSDIPRRLWIDAICINQADIMERNIQVQLMRKLYSSANCVLSWLGSNLEADIPLAFQTIKLIGTMGGPIVPPSQRYQLSRRSSLVTLNTDSCSEGSHMPSVGNPDWRGLLPDLWEVQERLDTDDICLDTRWKAINDFMDLTYWCRVWIIQEIVLSKPTSTLLMYEDEIITFQDLISCHKVIKGLLQEIHDNDEKKGFLRSKPDRLPCLVLGMFWQRFGFYIGLMRDIDEAYTLNHGIDLPFDVRYFMKTDPRDAVYGVLGLTLATRASIEVDFSKRVEEVYTDWFIYYLKKTKSLEKLSLTGIALHMHPNSNIPSWVPDLRHAPTPIHGLGGPLLQNSSRNWNGLTLNPSGEFPRISDRTILHLLLATWDKSESFTVLDKWNRWTSLKEFCVAYLAKPRQRRQNFGMSSLKAIMMNAFEGGTHFHYYPDNWFFAQSDQCEILDRQFDPWLDRPKAQHDSFSLLSFTPQNYLITLLFVRCLAQKAHEDYQLDTDFLDAIGLSSDHTFYKKFCALFFPEMSPDSLNEGVFPPDSFWDSVSGKIFDEFTMLNRFDSYVFFETSRGHLGKGPLGLNVGDHIVLAENCTSPFAIRKTDSKFQLVSSCYVAGLCEIEGRKMFERGELLVEDIPLS